MIQDMKKQMRYKKYRKGIFCALAILLVFWIASSLVKRNSPYRMTMYDNHTSMEHEILRVIPVAIPVSKARQIMELNDFTCISQTSNLLRCEQVNSTFFGLADLSNDWYVEISLKKGVVTGAKVWVQPSHSL